MSESDNGKKNAGPTYLDSIRLQVDREDIRLFDWEDAYPSFRQLLLVGSRRSEGNGIRVNLSAGLLDIHVSIQTMHYGYEASYSGPDWPSVLEQIENDLVCKTVPWRPDWRRRRANSKVLEI